MKLKITITLFFIIANITAQVNNIKGNLSVSLTGAANYSIPIDVPPGINDVKPNLSLFYDSQGADGMAGLGWNISGLSSITRISSTKYHDDLIDPVDMDAFDRFALDGQRLLVRTDSPNQAYGGHLTVYETENFSNIKITGFNAIPTNPTSTREFKVEYPDGSVAIYSNIGGLTTYTIRSWQNPQGIIINYIYTSQNNNLLISSIKYGSSGTNVPINEVNFVYKSRTNIIQSFVGGANILNDKILSSINIKGNGLGYTNYNLVHGQFLKYQRLNMITQKTGDNFLSYSSTSFTYDDHLSGFTGIHNYDKSMGIDSYYTHRDGGSYFDPLTGDFDGDGQTDFLEKGGGYRIYTNISDDNSQINVSLPYIEQLPPFGSYSLLHTMKILENDGTGFKLMNRDAWGSSWVNNGGTTFKVFSYDQITNKPKFEYEKSINFMSHGFQFNGDFNGDGLSDKIVFKSEVNGNPNVYFVDMDRRLDSNYVKDLGVLTNIVQNQEKLIKVGDFNGDGKSDLIIFRGGSVNTISVYSLDKNNNLIKIWETPYQFIHTGTKIFIEQIPGQGYYPCPSPVNICWEVPPVTYDYPVVVGDFNGDGKSDIILPGLERVLLLSTGTSFVAEPLPSNFIPRHELKNLLAVDFDNDGKTDILSLSHNDTNLDQPASSVNLTINYVVRNNLGGTWINSSKTFLGRNKKYWKSGGIVPAMIIPSKTLKGRTELVLIENDRVSEELELGFFINMDALYFGAKALKTITDGNSVENTITYSPLISGQTQYSATLASSNHYPFYDIVNAPDLYVVSQIQKTASDISMKQLFSYYGAVSNKEGLGFLGFSGVSRTNWFNDYAQIITSVTKFDHRKRGAPVDDFSITGLFPPYLTLTQNEEFINRTQKFYNNEDTSNPEPMLMPNKVFKLKNTLSNSFNGLELTSSSISTIFNSNNNPLTISRTIKNGNNIEEIFVEDFEYDATLSSPYMVGRPKSKKSSTTIFPSNQITSSEELYTFEKNLLKEVKKKGHNTEYITESNIYDLYGNVTKKTLSANGLASRIQNYEYDNDTHRFLTKKTDLEGQITLYTYDLSTGQKLSETLPSNTGYPLKTTYAYDKFRKLTTITDYLNKSQTYTYGYSTEGTAITIQNAMGEYFQEIRDKLGRVIRENRKLIDGAFSVVEMKYDIHNRLIAKSQPYEVAPSIWNEAEYDIFGRLIKGISLKGPGSPGKVIEYEYLGLITNEVSAGITKMVTRNAKGNIKTVTESPGGTIDYEYFPGGNLKSTTCNASTIINTQDGWGRKLTSNDSASGVYVYEYNTFGEITKEILVGKGETVFTINNYGKVTTKTTKNAGGTLLSKNTYTYNGTTKLIDQIRYDNYEAGSFTLYGYQYDDYRRVKFKDESGFLAYYQQAVLYDEYGRPDKELYHATNTDGNQSSIKWIKNTYKNGYRWQIIDDLTGTILWQTNTTHQNGQLISATLGNGIVAANTYDDFGFIKKTSLNRGKVSIMSLNTTFNSITGNLTSRTNNMFMPLLSITPWSETLTYDSQDRLLTYKDENNILTQNYNENGTISNNNIGTYAYTVQDKPYQLSTITPGNPSPSLTYYTGRQQDILYNLNNNPVSIKEENQENVDFEYNAFNERSAMFYGGLQEDKNLRPYRKFYSADGSMEIKRKTSSPTSVEFVFYIGGDAYTAPVILKSDGLTQDYFYLHRDYQGTIVAITNQAGAVVEKRLFDVWGALIKYYNSNGTTTIPTNSYSLFIDRGYTGHEHLLGSGLINMNGRIYDPKLHRFLQTDSRLQDATNTQNYNSYSYVMNNPTKYIDPSGESWMNILGFIFSSYIHTAQATGEGNPFKWNASNFANFVLGATSYVVSSEASEIANNYIDSYGNGVLNSTAATPVNASQGHDYVATATDEALAYSLMTGVLGNWFKDAMDITKADFLRGTFSYQNVTDFTENINAGIFINVYEKGYRESLRQVGYLKLGAKALLKSSYYVGYLEAGIKMYDGDILGAGISGASNYAGEYIGNLLGWGYGLAWQLTWTGMDKYVSQTEMYNRLLFGKGSDVYIERGLKNGWYSQPVFHPGGLDFLNDVINVPQ